MKHDGMVEQICSAMFFVVLNEAFFRRPPNAPALHLAALIETPLSIPAATAAGMPS